MGYKGEWTSSQKKDPLQATKWTNHKRIKKLTTLKITGSQEMTV